MKSIQAKSPEVMLQAERTSSLAMPKPLFYKISEEKQERILNAALNEFLEYRDHYAKASVNRIAKEAGIAVGSLYKYFKDKNDLFIAVLEKFRQRPDVNSDCTDFKDFVYKNFDLGVSLEEPSLSLLNIVQNTSDLFEDLALHRFQGPDSVFRRAVIESVQRDKDAGIIRENIPDELILYLYTSLEYLADSFVKNNPESDVGSNDIFRILVDIMFNGINS